LLELDSIDMLVLGSVSQILLADYGPFLMWVCA